MGAAVRFDGHGSQHPAARHDRVARRGHAQGGLVRRPAGRNTHRQHLQHAQVRDPSVRRPRLEAVVDVQHGHRAFRRRSGRRAHRPRRGIGVRTAYRQLRSRHRHRPWTQGDRTEAGNLRVAVQQFLVPKRIDQVDAVVAALVSAALHPDPRLHPRVVHAQEVVLAQRPRRPVALPAALTLRKTDFGRDAPQRSHAVVVPQRRVDQDQRPVRLTVMRRRDAHQLVGIRNRPAVQFHVGASLPGSVVAVHGPRIASV